MCVLQRWNRKAYVATKVKLVRRKIKEPEPTHAHGEEGPTGTKIEVSRSICPKNTGFALHKFTVGSLPARPALSTPLPTFEELRERQRKMQTARKELL